MRYAVHIVESKSDLVFVQADSKEEAEAIVKANLDNGTIQLDEHTTLEISASAASQEVSPYDQNYKMPDDSDTTDVSTIAEAVSALR